MYIANAKAFRSKTVNSRYILYTIYHSYSLHSLNIVFPWTYTYTGGRAFKGCCLEIKARSSSNNKIGGNTNFCKLENLLDIKGENFYN